MFFFDTLTGTFTLGSDTYDSVSKTYDMTSNHSYRYFDYSYAYNMGKTDYEFPFSRFADYSELKESVGVGKTVTFPVTQMPRWILLWRADTGSIVRGRALLLDVTNSIGYVVGRKSGNNLSEKLVNYTAGISSGDYITSVTSSAVTFKNSNAEAHVAIAIWY